jgi:hypothetical protein
MRARVQTLVD